MYVNILALWTVELDRLYVRLVSHTEGYHRLPSAQVVRAVPELLRSWGKGGEDKACHDSDAFAAKATVSTSRMQQQHQQQQQRFTHDRERVPP